LNDDLLKITGMDSAVIGICMTWHGNMLVERIIYDGKQVTAILQGQGMSEEEAQEYIDFNIIGAYAGESTPIIMWPSTLDEIDERP
jgi:hypothetical protein